MGKMLAVAVVVLMGCGQANGYDACAEMLPALCSRYEACGTDAAGCRAAAVDAAAGRFCCGPSCTGPFSQAAADGCKAQIESLSCAVLAQVPVPSCFTAVVVNP